MSQINRRAYFPIGVAIGSGAVLKLGRSRSRGACGCLPYGRLREKVKAVLDMSGIWSLPSGSARRQATSAVTSRGLPIVCGRSPKPVRR